MACIYRQEKSIVLPIPLKWTGGGDGDPGMDGCCGNMMDNTTPTLRDPPNPNTLEHHVHSQILKYDFYSTIYLQNSRKAEKALGLGKFI